MGLPVLVLDYKGGRRLISDAQSCSGLRGHGVLILTKLFSIATAVGSVKRSLDYLTADHPMTMLLRAARLRHADMPVWKAPMSGG